MVRVQISANAEMTETKIGLVSWCFAPSQPQRIILGLDEDRERA